MEQKQGYQASLKSIETEDWLDLHVIRPLCYQIARLFAVFDIHPNTVTIWSMIIGVISAYFFAQTSFYYNGTTGLLINLIGVFLLMWADIFDCVDGQLARLTGKKSPIGRILDGMAGFVWFIPIYLCIVYRFYLNHDIEFSFLGIENNEQNTLIATGIVLILSFISGFQGMGGQQRVADYYIQVHLLFLKGEEGSELDHSDIQRQKLKELQDRKASWAEIAFQKSYIDYTIKQEKATPEFQNFVSLATQKYGGIGKIPSAIREEFHKESLALIKWNGLLTFNFRAAFFFMFCLLDVPALNFVWEIVGMGLLTAYVQHRHEAFSKRLAEKL